MTFMKRIAVVTGASSGLGMEFARQISQKYDYDELWLVARRAERLETLSVQLSTDKKRVRPVPMDISGMDGVHHFASFLKNEAAGDSLEIGLFVNNAGFGTYGPMEETDSDRQMQMVNLNCTALTGLCSVVIPYMTKGSVLINTASLAAYMPLGNFAVYGASKAFVLSLSIALAAELKDKGIKVCALCPGSVSTEFASEGVRKEVLGGKPADKVVAHCLKRAFRGKKTAVWALKWKISAIGSHFVDRYTVARWTFLHHKRPHIVR